MVVRMLLVEAATCTIECGRRIFRRMYVRKEQTGAGAAVLPDESEQSTRRKMSSLLYEDLQRDMVSTRERRAA